MPIKRGPWPSENSLVNLHRCPYDTTPVTTQVMPGGATVITCGRCGAEWELRNTLVHQTSEPDWDEVRRARAFMHRVAGSSVA